MEPTIYKPSIYKGAGIYNTGAEGGGGGDIPNIFKNVYMPVISFGTQSYLNIDNENKLIYSKEQEFVICPKLNFDWRNINKIECGVHFYCIEENLSYPLSAIYIRGTDLNGNYLSRVATLSFYRPAGGNGCQIRYSNNDGTQFISEDYFNGSAWNKDMKSKIIVEKKDNGTRIIIDARPCITDILTKDLNYNLPATIFGVSFGGYGLYDLTNNHGVGFCRGSNLYSNGTYIKIDDALVFGEE